MSLPLEYSVTLPDGQTYNQPSGLFINNEFVKSKSGEIIESYNPSTSEVNGRVYAAGPEDVDLAVSAARKAFKSWKKVKGDERGRLLYRFADAMEKQAELITAIEAWDSGKPKVNNAAYDIQGSIDIFRYYAGWADKVQGRVIQNDSSRLGYTIHEPFGVCGQIIPWNYPIAMATWKIAPALAAGNVVVLKTSELTPLSLLFLAQLFRDVGFPPGVVNIISGYGPIAGSALASHLDVDKIAFTGSTATGAAIQKAASANMKAVTLELGGKSPMIIRADADLEQAAKWAALGIMSNQGQICSANSRLYVHESVYEKFLKIFAQVVERDYKQGDMFDSEAVVGPQVSKLQHDKVLKYIEIGKQEGARVITGGEKNTTGDLAKGYYVKPTIFADVDSSMRIVQEEIFGPVVVVGKFSTDEEVIKTANNSQYGLAAMIFTKDLSVAHTMAADLEAGMVWINESNSADGRMPFGGVKMSGIGRELGEYGLNMYTQAKAVHVNLTNKL